MRVFGVLVATAVFTVAVTAPAWGEATAGAPPAAAASGPAADAASSAILDAARARVAAGTAVGTLLALFCGNLRAFLELQDGLEVVGEAGDGEQTVVEAQRLRPDLVLMDLAMPKGGGLDATRRIAESGLPVKVLILTAQAEAQYLLPVLRAGGSGYLFAWGSGMTGSGPALMNGAPGFFRPRAASPWFHPPGTVEATSYYDTAQLKATLESVIDFDRVNAELAETRLSLGAVNVRSGGGALLLRDTAGPDDLLARRLRSPGGPDGWSDLRFLTFLTLSYVVPVHQRQKRTRALFPRCYRDLRYWGAAFYDPLLWTLKSVTVSSRPSCPLR